MPHKGYRRRLYVRTTIANFACTATQSSCTASTTRRAAGSHDEYGPHLEMIDSAPAHTTMSGDFNWYGNEAMDTSAVKDQRERRLELQARRRSRA